MDNLLTDSLQVQPLVTNTGSVGVDVLRLDLLHPIISGNKWFKLKGHLQVARVSPGLIAGAPAVPDRPILTFGGAWSNHLVATAFAAKQLGLTAIGIVRGEPAPKLSATLEDAASYGMSLVFISREEYARKEQPGFLQELARAYPGVYIIPEGGGGEAGILGCKDILKGMDTRMYTHILCAIGTGTTFLGLVLASVPGQQIIGVPVLKGFDRLEAIDKENILTPEFRSRCHLLPDFHFGGYARHPQQLLDFMNRFYHRTGIPSDIVYTGKLFYALQQGLSQSLFPAHSRLLVIHSGGLQGNQSLPPGKLDF